MTKDQIVALANEVGETLTGGRFEPVKELIDTNDVAFAVWQDAQEPDGVGMLIVKGERRLLTITTARKAEPLSITAIPCQCADQAVALNRSQVSLPHTTK